MPRDPDIYAGWSTSGEYILIDLADLWAETFARWDALTDTDTAIRIASATVSALRQSTNNEHGVSDSPHTTVDDLTH